MTANSTNQVEIEDFFAKHEFIVPTTRVKLPSDMVQWFESSAYHDYLGFILTLNDAIKGKQLSTNCQVSELTISIINLLDTISTWIDDIKPIEQPQRFGNKAFRIWHQKLIDNAVCMTENLLPNNLKKAAPEISSYLVDGFGNSTRIDYGTGHEAAFACFMCCFFKIRLLQPEDKQAAVLKVFRKYLQVCRKLQGTYRMEPAGSQGVWGLDDFQFLPFIWGSSQFYSHPTIRPCHFVEDNIISQNKEEYMFLQSIAHIHTTKSGPFAEHSNILWGISGVEHWGKVNSGLIKMYKAEILKKFPIIQHVKFGSILSFDNYNK